MPQCDSFCVVEPLQSRLLAYADGVVANLSPASAGGDVDATGVQTLISRMKALGTRSVRIYHETPRTAFTTDTDDFTPTDVNYLKEIRHAGFSITLLINPAQGTTQSDLSYTNVNNYFRHVIADYAPTDGRPSIFSSVARWEIGNEINLPDYYPQSTGNLPAGQLFAQTANHYVGNFLRGAWDALHPNGGARPNQVVVGASVRPASVSTFDAFDELVKADVSVRAHKATTTRHYTDYCDVAALHPYGLDATHVDKYVLNALKDLAATHKPLTITEWTIKNDNFSNQKISQQLNVVQDYLSTHVDSAFYNRIRRKDTTKPLQYGLYDIDFVTKDNPFWDDFHHWTTGL